MTDVNLQSEKREDSEIGDGHEEGPTARRSIEEIQTFTLGYQGRTLSEVLRIVQVHAIHQVLDVRQVAASRKPGFAASELEEALARIGVTYVHLPELGCEREARHALWRGGATDDYMGGYRQQIAGRPDAVGDLVLRVRSARSLLLCLERNPAECHRAVLGERLRGEGIAVLDL